jgi:hypothetical protein
MSKPSVSLILNILEVEKQGSVGWGKTKVLFTQSVTATEMW